MNTPRKATHTPTPWHIIDTDNVWALFSGSQPVANVGKARNGLADAAFIVRAVNCHEELLMALKRALEDAGEYDGWREVAEQAIARASSGRSK